MNWWCNIKDGTEINVIESIDDYFKALKAANSPHGGATFHLMMKQST